MKNLAGNKDCDKEIERELTRCSIEVVPDQPRVGEVPSSLLGKLGLFTFFRAWYYWVVRGDMPLKIAQELYNDPVGKTDIRVCGDCSCPAPEGVFITWRDKDGKVLLSTIQREALLITCGENNPIVKKVLEEYRFVDDPAAEGSGFVVSYHIDTELGLRIFADTLKRHGLA